MMNKYVFMGASLVFCLQTVHASDQNQGASALDVSNSLNWTEQTCEKAKEADPYLMYPTACYQLLNLKEAAQHEDQRLAPETISNGRVAMAFGTDGCFPSSPVWSKTEHDEIRANPGQDINLKLTDKCAYKDQFEKSYVLYNEIPLQSSKKEDQNTYAARIYAMYAVKDETGVAESSGYAHQHEWEHIIVWMKNDKPDYVSVTQHSAVATKKAKDVAHLKDDPNTFAVKYIHGRFWNILKVSTHFFDFADKDKNGVAKNTNPTPSGQWFGLGENELVDYSKTSQKFQNIIADKNNWGETRPRINDKSWLDGKVCNVFKCPFDFMKSNVIPWDNVKTMKD